MINIFTKNWITRPEQFGFEESTNCCCIGLPRRTTPVDCVLLSSHHTLVKVRFELHLVLASMREGGDANLVVETGFQRLEFQFMLSSSNSMHTQLM